MCVAFGSPLFAIEQERIELPASLRQCSFLSESGSFTSISVCKKERCFMSTARPKRPPEKKIGPFAGGIGVAIWINSVETDAGTRQIRSITVAPRRYFDQESNQWKDAPSFRPSDLPALIFALEQAQEYCYTTPLPGEDNNPDDDAHDGQKPPF
jgi:hypothetical protein